jgi:hypothetical protein
MRARLTSWKACDGLSFPQLLHIIRHVLENLAVDSFCIRNIVAHEQVKLLNLNGVCYKDQALLPWIQHRRLTIFLLIAALILFA